MQNQLKNETSPYLLQHADNPVYWYAWGEEAFEEARRSNRPVLLSVGYSACHWCHVMAHESFEDESTAAVMNELFVNVKVDREERPDIDKIYQTAHQLITQRAGGWPLTMFIDPDDQRPFFGGTYFPNTARHGMPGFTELLESVAKYYSERREEAKQQGAKIHEVFDKLVPPPAPDATLDAEPLAGARAVLGKTFDHDYGGFGSAPKFPHPVTIDYLLRYWRSSANGGEPDIEALYMATLTLKRMADGGIFDHVGGGFCRYSVDKYWQIPHFEKMLYDNGPLLALYAQAYLASGDESFRETAGLTADWMLADMRAPNGGLYSARDADSEGEEGLYYLFTPDAVEALLEPGDYAFVSRYFGLDQPANFEGQWHLCLRKSFDESAEAAELTADQARAALGRARKALLEARAEREAPLRDEKQLTAWNALAIRGFAIAGRALEREDLVDAAGRALEFIRDTLMVDGRLHASYKDGRVRFNAYLDDYVFLIDAILEYLQSRWDSSLLDFATTLADRVLERFADTANGGFYFTANDHEQLMHRGKPVADDALPAGNGVAAYALQRLGFVLGRTDYLDAAEATLRFAWRAMQEYPHGHVMLLTALEEQLSPCETIVIRGDSEEIEGWRRSAAKIYAPRRLVFAIPRDEDGLPGALAERTAREGETLAYRCVGTHCDLPVTNFAALALGMREADSDSP
ncbi:MAG: thioredoxin domain-containing protein [Pseudomonadota bacterium]